MPLKAGEGVHHERPPFFDEQAWAVQVIARVVVRFDGDKYKTRFSLKILPGLHDFLPAVAGAVRKGKGEKNPVMKVC